VTDWETYQHTTLLNRSQ